MGQEVFTDEQKHNVANNLKNYIDTRRCSREQLAIELRLGKGTIDKACTGIFSRAFLNKFTAQTSVNLLSNLGSQGVAPKSLGGYTLSDFEQYIGTYKFARHSFENPEKIILFNLVIEWDDQESCLQAKAIGRDQSIRMGNISIPKISSSIFFESNTDGWISSMVLSHMNHEGILRGLMLSSANLFGSNYLPYCNPVVLTKETSATMPEYSFTVIDSAHDDYENQQRLLASVIDSKYAKIFGA